MHSGKAPNHDLSEGYIKYCQVCGAAELKFVIDLGHQAPCDTLLTTEQLNHEEKTYPLRMFWCEDCSLAQIDYVVPPESLFYAEYPYRSGITPTLVKNLKGLSSVVVERNGINPPGLVIDIGSSDGTLLSGFKEKGFQVLGVEPTNIAKIANTSGIETMQSFFNEAVAHDIVKLRGNASVVTASNVFAHIARLGEMIRGVKHLLSDKGLFITESHYLLDILDTVQYDSIYHEHLKFYSLKSIIRLFKYYGFTVVDAEKIENYGGSIRVFAAKDKSRPISESVNSLLAEEEKFGLYSFSKYKEFSERAIKAKYELQALSLQAFSKQKSFVGIGCPGRSSTLLNYCNMDNQLMPYIAEQSTSLKLGLHLPGKHIPIVDEEIMFKEQPDYAVMLSWHYWEPIVKKLRQKGLKSKIVIPLPELKILEP
jgi:2-polyprenyl-3-methyl-5-hydroxy-6-metoxy-1,4-benzoquinol methylase